MLALDKKIYYTLRFAAAMCFIGHGAFGIITKKIWLNYFAVFGIGPVTGYHLMPVVGTIDILCGISLLFHPTRLILCWLVIWGFVTAWLRPLSGEPFAEMIERAGNFGAPLTLLILYGFGTKGIKGWVTLITPIAEINEATIKRTVLCLKMVAFLLLAGHGWLNLIEKKGLMSQYSSLGFSNPAQVGQVVGFFELLAAFTVLIKPVRPLIFIFLIWKMGTELFYPHWELFEWIERGGSYGALLALWFALPKISVSSRSTFKAACL